MNGKVVQDLRLGDLFPKETLKECWWKVRHLFKIDLMVLGNEVSVKSECNRTIGVQ